MSNYISKFSNKICVSAAPENYEQALFFLSNHHFAELRMENLELSGFEWEDIMKISPKIVSACRSTDYSANIEKLAMTALLGVKYLDIDVGTNYSDIEYLLSAAPKNMITPIFSYHNYEFTPNREEIQYIIDNARNFGNGIVKIACRTNSNADISRLLSLYENNKSIIVLPMNGNAVFSRISALELGAEFIFAADREFTPTAHGQVYYDVLMKWLAQADEVC